eukprot:COSAG02_NODE_1653_length_11488_cov_66.480815_12_plen_301_part_00
MEPEPEAGTPESEAETVVGPPDRTQFTHQIGQYLFNDTGSEVDTLGVGAQGKVYPATHCTQGGEFALKLSFEQRWSAAQLHEVMYQQACQEHEFVVPIKDVLYDKITRLDNASAVGEKRLAIVMEQMKGGELFDEVLAADDGLSEEQAKIYFRQILLAMAHVHARGVSHRDMKLENLLLNEDKTACKVCDFGLAKYVPEQAFLESLVGTCTYVAPEVVESPQYDPFKADMWSCGVVLYCMTECRFPFNAGTKMLRSRTILSPETVETLRLMKVNTRLRHHSSHTMVEAHNHILWSYSNPH